MAISLTESAADRVRSFLVSRGRGLGLRLGVRKTGCSGFAYVVNYADDSRPDDVVFEDHGVKVFVDPFSAQYLEGGRTLPLGVMPSIEYPEAHFDLQPGSTLVMYTAG